MMIWVRSSARSWVRSSVRSWVHSWVLAGVVAGVAGVAGSWAALSHGQPASQGQDAAPRGQDPRQFPAGAPPAGSSITNPAISAIGWVQAVAGNDTLAQERAIELREVELAIQAAVDPFTRADFFVAASEEGLEIEEGTITWLAMPGGGQARIGKYRADLGKFNRVHPPETPFADRPLATEAFLGEEGLVTTGATVSFLLPNPFDLYWELIGNGGTVPDESPLFEGEERSDLLGLGRTVVFIPAGNDADVNLGLSYANAPARLDARATEGNHAQIAAGDLTVRWKSARRNDRSLWLQGEYMSTWGSAAGAPSRTGGFAYGIWQFARQWRIGARWDWTESPGTDDHASGGLALLEYQPSEFSTLSVQGRRIREGDIERDAVFFKWVFSIGPHGTHPY